MSADASRPPAWSVRAHGAPRPAVVAALSVREWRVAWRSRRVLMVVVVAIASSLAAPEVVNTVTAVSAAFFSGLFAAAILAGGIIARDFESGAMALARLHGARASEMVIASHLFVTTVAAGVFLVLLSIGLFRFPDIFGWGLVVPVGACLLGLIAWTSILVVLGCALPGVGNAAAAIALAVFGSVDRFGGPPVVAKTLEFLRDALPLPHLTGNILRDSMTGASVLNEALTLVVGAVAASIAGVVVLGARDPASGWRR